MGFELKKFAIKRSIFSAVAAGIINSVIVYFTLSHETNIPLFASVAEIWNHSLIGALIPRSILISLFITITTVFATTREAARKSEIISDRLKEISWIRIAITKALIRAAIAFISVILLAVILRMIFPTYAILPAFSIIPLVGIFSALVAFSMTYSAVLTAGRILEAKK